jgi:hypothetical protein
MRSALLLQCNAAVTRGCSRVLIAVLRCGIRSSLIVFSSVPLAADFVSNRRFDSCSIRKRGSYLISRRLKRRRGNEKSAHTQWRASCARALLCSQLHWQFCRWGRSCRHKPEEEPRALHRGTTTPPAPRARTKFRIAGTSTQPISQSPNSHPLRRSTRRPSAERGECSIDWVRLWANSARRSATIAPLRRRSRQRGNPRLPGSWRRQPRPAPLAGPPASADRLRSWSFPAGRADHKEY